VDKTTQRVTLLSVLISEYCSGDQIKKNEMVGACGRYETYRRQDTFVEGFGREN
jgi:putative salt-induced outer membrane protein YdiY